MRDYETLKDLVPKDKFDDKRLNEIGELSDGEFEIIVPDLLTWMQDMNWPVATPVSGVLLKRYNVVEDHLCEILKADQKDDEWKRNVINYLLKKWPARITNEGLINEIKRIAEKPFSSEKKELVDEAARDIINLLS